MKKDEHGVTDLYGTPQQMPPELQTPENKKEQILSALKAFAWFLVSFLLVIAVYKLVIGYMMRGTKGSDSSSAPQSAVCQTLQGRGELL